MSEGTQTTGLPGNSLASATLSAHGVFTWKTPRAREWLDTYLEECGAGARLRFQQWISSISSGSQCSNVPGSRICLSRQGARLYVHLLGKSEDGDFLILLDEYRELGESPLAPAAQSAASMHISRHDFRSRLATVLRFPWAGAVASKKALARAT